MATTTQVTPYRSPGQPDDGTGAVGDISFDTVGRIVWVKQSGNTWSNGGYSNIGPTGPALLSGSGAPANSLGQNGYGYVDLVSGITYLKSSNAWAQTGSIVGPVSQPQPTLGSLANSWGPVAQLNNVSVTASGTQMYAAGTTQGYAFVAPYNTSFNGAQITNYNATGASLGFAIINQTDNTTLWSGSQAQNTVNNYLFASGTYPIVSGKTYIWACSRSGGGTAYMNIVPIYQQQATNGSSTSYYQNAVLLTSAAYTLSTTQQVLGAAGMTNQTWFYKYGGASYLYLLSGQAYGSGTLNINFANYTSPAITLSSSGTFFSFGPFGVSTCYLTAAQQYSMSVTGSGSLTSISANISVGM